MLNRCGRVVWKRGAVSHHLRSGYFDGCFDGHREARSFALLVHLLVSSQDKIQGIFEDPECRSCCLSAKSLNEGNAHVVDRHHTSVDHHHVAFTTAREIGHFVGSECIFMPRRRFVLPVMFFGERCFYSGSDKLYVKRCHRDTPNDPGFLALKSLTF
jgi:hypothetical protein